MSVYAPIGGVIHKAAGILSFTPVEEPPEEVRLVPVMGSASQDGFTVFATSEYSEGGFVAAGWRAFNRVLGAGWGIGHSSTAQATPSAPQELGVMLAVPRACVSYSIDRRTDTTETAPTAWTVEGWNGSAWVVLDTRAEGWGASEFQKKYSFATSAIYSGYKLRCTASGVLCQEAELAFYYHA